MARYITWQASIMPAIQPSFLPPVHQTPKVQSNPLDFNSQTQVLSEKYGVNATLAKAIISCESHIYNRSINENKTQDGTVWSRDWGYWQINDFYWKEKLLEKGWDITIPSENLEAGFYLLKTYGIGLWSASQTCWQAQTSSNR